MSAAFDAEDSEFQKFLQKLLDGNHVEDEETLEVARHILDHRGPLDFRQTWLIARHVIQPFAAECVECEDPFPWSEAYEMIGTRRRCPSCEARYRRYMDV